MLLYSNLNNKIDIEKIKNKIPLHSLNDIIKIGGPRAVVSKRGSEAKLIEFISFNTKRNGEIWKVEFSKNKAIKEHTIFYTPNN